MKTITTNDYKKIINWLVSQRLLKGITQQQLSEILKRPQSFVSKYENSERRLDIIETLEICKAMGINAHDMINILLKDNK